MCALQLVKSLNINTLSHPRKAILLSLKMIWSLFFASFPVLFFFNEVLLLLHPKPPPKIITC
jgi:hypothetical protein